MSLSKQFSQFSRYAGVGAMAVVVLTPLAVMLATSLKTQRQIFDFGIHIPLRPDA